MTSTRHENGAGATPTFGRRRRRRRADHRRRRRQQNVGDGGAAAHSSTPFAVAKFDEYFWPEIFDETFNEIFQKKIPRCF